MPPPRPVTDRRRFLQTVGLFGFVGTLNRKQEEPTQVSSCRTIDESGRYVLTEDIGRDTGGRDTCIEITADDVVLDGQGHELNGADVGIAVVGDDVTIENIHFVNTGTDIEHRGTSNGVVRNVTSRLGFDGIGLVGVEGALITNCDIENDSTTVYLNDSVDTVIQNSRFKGLSESFEVGNSPGTVIRNCLMDGSDEGLTVSRSDRTRIVGNTFRSMGWDPLSIGSSEQCTVSDNTFRNNYDDTDEATIHLSEVSRSEVSQNLVENNESSGILLTNSNSNQVVRNWSTGNAGDGIALEGSDGCELVQNVACGNADEQIRIDDASTGTVSRENSESCGPGQTLEVVPVGEECTYRVEVTGTIEPASVRGREPNPDDEIDDNTVTGKLLPGADGDAFRFTGDIVALTTVNGDCRFFVDGAEVDVTDVFSHTLEVVPVGEDATYRVEVTGKLVPAEINGREPNPDDEIEDGTVTGQIAAGSDGDAFRFSGEIVEIVILEGDCRFLVDGNEVEPDEDGDETPQHTLEVVPVGVDARYRAEVTGEIEPAEINGREPNPDDEIDGGTVTGRIAAGSDGDAFRFSGEIVEIVILEGDCRFLVDGNEVEPDEEPSDDGGDDERHTLEVVPAGEECTYRVEVTGEFEPAEINGREPNPDDEIDGGTLIGHVFPGSDGDAFQFTGEIVEITIVEGDCQFIVDGEAVDPGQYALRPS